MAAINWVSAESAAALPVDINVGAVQGRIHRMGPAGDPYRFVSPAPSATSSWTNWVSAGNEARASHGRQSDTYPSHVNINTQSVIGIIPQAPPSPVTEGQPFLLARFAHYNNPVLDADEHASTELQIRLGSTDFSLPAELWETPNSASPCPPPAQNPPPPGGCQDLLSFDSHVADGTITIDGYQYRLIASGFTDTNANGSCPATPSGLLPDQFITDERDTTYGCFYAQLDRIRDVTIKKVATLADGSPLPSGVSRDFDFTSQADLPGSQWNADFTLAPDGTVTRKLLSSEKVSIQENPTGDDRWELASVECVNQDGEVVGADGAGHGVSVNGSEVVIDDVVSLPDTTPGLTTPDKLTCTFTNHYTPKGTLTLRKVVNGGPANPEDFTLTATGPTTISGPGNSASVTSQRVNTGDYVLSEIGAAAYVQDGTWQCDGGTLSGNTVTVADGDDVTCTVTNRYSTGNLEVVKTIDDPDGGFIGNGNTQFSGQVTCTAPSGQTFNYSTATANAWQQTAIPAGSQCRIENENTPSQTLLQDSSFSWVLPGLPSAPVAITDGSTQQLELVNTVAHSTGYLRVGKVVEPAAGTTGAYTGGPTRTFPISYTCELPAGTVVASGTVNQAAGTDSTPIEVSTGAVCSFSEPTPTQQAGDFPDDSYYWLAPTIPADVTITASDDPTNAQTARVTNTYERRYGSINLAKAVTGPGAATVDAAKEFTISYDCGAGFTGTVDVTAGSQETVADLPLNAMCTFSEPTPPQGSDGLAAAYAWGAPTYSDAGQVTVAATPNTGTVTNPTVAIYAKLQVTKQLTGATDGVPAGSLFPIEVSCDAPAEGEAANYSAVLNVTANGSVATPNLPVGTSCTVTEQSQPALLNESYAWDPIPAAQTVVAQPADATVNVDVTNNVVRQYGSLSVTKVVTNLDGAYTGGDFTGTWSCTGNTTANGTWQTSGAGAATMSAGADQILYGSTCTVSEDSTLPALTGGLYGWASPSYAPDQSVTVNTATPNPAVTVTNEVLKVNSNFSLQKLLGTNPQGAAANASFTLGLTCTDPNNPGQPGVTASFDLAANGQVEISGGVPDGWDCSVTETGVDAADLADADRFRWDGVDWSFAPAQPADWTPAGDTVTFTSPTLPADTVAVVTATNNIAINMADLTVAKTVTGETAGYTGLEYKVTADCGADGTYEFDLSDGASDTVSLPVNSVCTVTESDPGRDGLKDDSYAYGTVTYNDGSGASATPATVTVSANGASVTVENPIVRVTSDVTLSKTLTDPYGVVDPNRHFAGEWSCDYDGTEVAAGTWDTTAGATAVVVGTDIPLTSVCTVDSEDLTVQPNPTDDSYIWQAASLGTVTVTADGAELKVANSVVREYGSISIRKQLSGATEGYIGTGDDFTVGYTCTNPNEPGGATLTGSATVPVAATYTLLSDQIPYSWECTPYEDTPGADLLNPDGSYTWGTATIDPTDFTVSGPNSAVEVTITNDIERVYGSFAINKVLQDVPVTAVTGDFTGTWSCQYGADAAVTGTWTAPAGGGAATLSGGGQGGVPGRVLVDSECSAVEDAPPAFTDPSWSWNPVVVSNPIHIAPGAPVGVTVTNSASRVLTTLTIEKQLLADPIALAPGAKVAGGWECAYDGNPQVTTDDATFNGRWELDAAGATTTAADNAGNPVAIPVGSTCTVREDTLTQAQLRDESYRWLTAEYAPANAAGDAAELTLVDGENKATVSNNTERVRSLVIIDKAVVAVNNATGPSGSTVDPLIEYRGTYECVYTGDETTAVDDEVLTGDWATQADPLGLEHVAGVLVGSKCRVTSEEDPPQPVPTDQSYLWVSKDLGLEVVVPSPISQPDDHAVITVTNSYDRLLGGFAVAKRVVGVEPVLLGDPKFQVDVHCVADDAVPEFTGQAEIGDQESWSSPENLADGSTCELVEQVPTAGGSSYTWLEPYWTVVGLGENDTVQSAGNKASVTLPLGDAAPVVTVWNPVVRNGFTMTKTSDPATGADVKPDDVITYTIKVTPETGGARGVVVEDDLSDVLDNATLVPGSISASKGTAALSGTVLTWQVGDLAGSGPDLSEIPGHENDELGEAEVATITYQVKVNSDAWNQTLRNVATGHGDDGCIGDCKPSTEHNTSGYVVTKTSDPSSDSPVKPGDKITYTINVTNDSGATVVDALISDDLTKVLHNAEWLGFVGEHSNTVVSETELTWLIPALNPGDSVKLSYQVKVKSEPDEADLVNVVTPGDGGRCPETGCSTTHKLPPKKPGPPDTGAGGGSGSAPLVGCLTAGYLEERRLTNRKTGGVK